MYVVSSVNEYGYKMNNIWEGWASTYSVFLQRASSQEVPLPPGKAIYYRHNDCTTSARLRFLSRRLLLVDQHYSTLLQPFMKNKKIPTVTNEKEMSRNDVKYLRISQKNWQSKQFQKWRRIRRSRGNPCSFSKQNITVDIWSDPKVIYISTGK